MGVEHDIVCIDCFGVLISTTRDVLWLCKYVTPQKDPRIFIIKIIIYSGYN